ncbi:MAG TPA: cupin domain-containing protein [Candidatus Sulfotelmatobacter sp.]|nr:cupin domain-containing protein [Candidatus Sulfotelmatobacter sp.]
MTSSIRSLATSPVQPPGVGLVSKPWGYELRWAVGGRYAGKIIHIDRGHALSLQYHERKEESIYITRGVLDLVLQDDAGALQTHRLSQGMSAHITPGRLHRFIAIDETDLVEVSSPELDDVVRIEDLYGRAGTRGDSSGPRQAR